MWLITIKSARNLSELLLLAAMNVEFKRLAAGVQNRVS